MDFEKVLAALEIFKTEVTGSLAEMAKRCDSLDEKFLASQTKKLAADSTDDLAEETAADGRRADAVTRGELEVVRAQLRDLQIKQPRAQTAADRNAFSDAQAKFDSTYRALGEGGAPPPMSSEALIDYQIRLARPIMKHSKQFAKVDLHTLARDVSTLESVLNSARADAYAVGISPVDMKPFVHRMIEETLPSGHVSRRFIGQGTCFAMQSAPVRRVLGIGSLEKGASRSAGGAVYRN
jgi:hypothetical protein